MTTQPKSAGPAWSLISEDDLFLFNEGTHYRLYDKLGAKPAMVNGNPGVIFSVWAPNAGYVSVIGDFNGWNQGAHPMRARGSSGIWEAFVPAVRAGARYKFHVASRHAGYKADKTDPFGHMQEHSPQTASIVHQLDYSWGDSAWMKARGALQKSDKPMSIYEMHMGSWQRAPEDPSRWLTYREVAPRLADHLTRSGFTHVEFLPLMEHPFYASWGYQTTGYFAPSSRYGTPQDFMYMVDYLHQKGIGVVLDWVPSHFPTDEHGLGYFDGTHLFEHADPKQGFHPDWKSAVFNYGRNEVRAFLISSAVFWLDKFHVDAIRVDAVASMLYLDYSRKEGEWVPNQYGGRENVEAINFLRQMNVELYRAFPDIQTIAEESTAWPMVSRPAYVGGLGFGYKWDMGWMHDTLKYAGLDPIYRRYHHNQCTFRSLYQFSENYVLPLSHDEVVHGKGSLIERMPGDEWQKFATLRLLLLNQWTQTGKKLLFMGCEFAQWKEWNHDTSLDWHLLENHFHQGVLKAVTDLNRMYRQLPAMHEGDCKPEGFEWVESNDADNSTLAFLRWSSDWNQAALVVMNFTPVPRVGYRVGVPFLGMWREVFNSDAADYSGSGTGNLGGVEASPEGSHSRPASLTVTLPPLGGVVLVWDRAAGASKGG